MKMSRYYFKLVRLGSLEKFITHLRSSLAGPAVFVILFLTMLFRHLFSSLIGIRSRIVRVEGKEGDHLSTTTTAHLKEWFDCCNLGFLY